MNWTTDPRKIASSIRHVLLGIAGLGGACALIAGCGARTTLELGDGAGGAPESGGASTSIGQSPAGTSATGGSIDSGGGSCSAGSSPARLEWSNKVQLSRAAVDCSTTLGGDGCLDGSEVVAMNTSGSAAILSTSVRVGVSRDGSSAVVVWGEANGIFAATFH